MEDIMSKKFCTECGAELTSDTGFCSNCGAITESVDKDRINRHYEEQESERKKTILGIVFIVACFLLTFILLIY